MRITLSQILSLLGLMGMLGVAVSIFLQKGLRDALQMSRDNVEVLLQSRDIDKEEWTKREASYVAQVARLEARVQTLESEVIKSIVVAVTTAAADATATAVSKAMQESRKTPRTPAVAPRPRRGGTQ